MITTLLAHLPVFVAVYEERSMAKAAARLGFSNAHISRKIADLEKELNSQLVQRTTRSVHITHEGELLYQSVKQILAIADNIDNLLHPTDNAAGKIRLVTSLTYGTYRLSAILGEFSRTWPGIDLEVEYADRPVNLIAEGIDIALVLTNTPGEGYVARSLGSAVCRMWASESYIKRCGEPLHPRELAEHNCILYKQGDMFFNTLEFCRNDEKVKVTLEGNLKINHVPSIIDAVLDGAGIGLLGMIPVEQLAANKQTLLRPLFPDWNPIELLPSYMIYPRREFMSHRVRLLVNYLLEKLPVKEMKR